MAKASPSKGSAEADAWRPTALVARLPAARLKTRLRARINLGRELIPCIQEAEKSFREAEATSGPSSLERYIARHVLYEELAQRVQKWMNSCEGVLRPALQPEDFAQVSFRERHRAELTGLGFEAAADCLRGVVVGAMATLEAIYEALPGRLSSGNPAPTLNLEPLFESRLVSRAPLDELLTRMARRTLPRHRPDCVGASKELCEAFAKGYLGAVHEPFNNDDHLPRLAGRVCGVITERANDRGDVAPETLKRILGGVGGVVQGIAEVRNAVGTGHGRPERPQGLTSALSNLAAEASTVFCLFLARNFLEEGQQGIASGAGRSSSEKA